MNKFEPILNNAAEKSDSELHTFLSISLLNHISAYNRVKTGTEVPH